MDTCTSSLTFKGSISEAITEAQRNKKLFLVYLSGKDEENSITLEQPSWLDFSVAESISRKCVFLHLIQGSVDASNFCAFYPQKSVPSISAVGYNGGKLLWQLEGHISAENLVVAIENTCASLQLQETAATVLTAALAMKNPEHSVSVALNIPASSTDNPQEAVTVISSEPTAERKSTEHAEETFSQSIHNNEFENANAGPSVSTIESTVKTPSKADKHEVHHSYTTVEDGSAASQEDSTLSDLGSCSKATIQKFSKENSHISPNAVEESVQDKKNDGSLTNVLKSNDVHLNIRLPDGSPLQAKFLVMDTLRMVKNYVDENQASGIGSYDLAVPYPRRVFSDQDMSKALSELGLVNRETLIVVPHHSVDRSFKGKSPSREHPNTRSGSDYSSDGGYFGYVKRMLSHVNPFSYFSVGASSSNSVPASDGGLWQYRPNPGLQSSLSGEERSHQQYSPNPRTTPSSDDVNKNRKTTTRQFGSNIHTLRDDENESSSRDRNVFWNGNSTQYGGDNNR